jgi:hypothetical protein
MPLRKDLFEGLCKSNPEKVRSVVSEHALILSAVINNDRETASNKLKAMELRYENMALLSSLEDAESERSERERMFDTMKRRYEWTLSKLAIYSPEDAAKAEKIE